MLDYGKLISLWVPHFSPMLRAVGVWWHEAGSDRVPITGFRKG